MYPDPTVVASMIFILSISVLGIAAGLAKHWLKVRTQQRASGAASKELQQKVERLERETAQRLENLEAIVVSQTWKALQEPSLSEADRQRRIVVARPHEAHPPAAEEMNRQRAAELAHRLAG